MQAFYFERNRANKEAQRRAFIRIAVTGASVAAALLGLASSRAGPARDLSSCQRLLADLLTRHGSDGSLFTACCS